MPLILLIGDETATYKEAGATASKIATAFQFEAKHTGFVEELFFRTGSIENIGTTKLILGIYAEGATTPTGKPLGSGELKETPLASNAWLTVSGLKVFVKEGTKYWLAALAVGGTINYNTSALTLGTPDSKSVVEHETLEENTWGANLKTGPAGFYGLGSELRFQAQLSSLGRVSRKTRLATQVRAKLTSLGTLKYNVKRITLAQLTSTGSLGRRGVHALSANVTFQGALRLTLARSLIASFAFAGSLQKYVTDTILAQLSFVGTRNGNITYTPRASLSFSGALQRFATVLKLLFGKMTSNGSLANSTTTRQLPAVLEAFSIDTGLKPGVGLFPGKGLYPNVGNFPRTLVSHEFVGSLTSNGFLHLLPIKTLVASLKTRGALERNMTHPVEGIVPLSTGLLGRTIYGLRGSVEFAGTLKRSISQRMVASLTFAGILRRRSSLVLSSTLRFVGFNNRSNTHTFSASINSLGSLQHSISRQLHAALGFAGKLKQRRFIPTQENNPVLLRFANEPDQLTHTLGIPTLTLSVPKIIPDKLTHQSVESYIVDRSPNNFEGDLLTPNSNLRVESNQVAISIETDLTDTPLSLMQMRNQVSLITYGGEHNILEVSESYTDI